MQSIFKFFVRFMIVIVVLNVAVAFALWTYASGYRTELTAQPGQMAVIFHTNNDHLREERLALALQLYDYGRVERILTAGGTRAIEGQIGAEDMALQLVLRGVLPEHLIVEDGSKDTIEGIRRLSAMDELEEYQLVYLSNCTQLPRIRQIHNRLIGDRIPFRGVCPKEHPGAVQIWLEAQYEFAAWSVLFLPEALRARLVEMMR